jgi:indolepyruvate ferredoxin oxidoreductase
VLDSKLYANIMMLGIAFQKGYLPLKHEVIEQAIRTLIRREADRNLRAFNIGRKIAVRPDLFHVLAPHEYESARQTLRRKLNTIRALRKGRRGHMIAKQFRVLMKQTFRATRGHRVDDRLRRDVVVRAYDCYVWGGIEYARRYCQRLVDVFSLDSPDQDYRLTRTVVAMLAKVMLIKDEPYVAAMLTSPEKYKRDRRRFNVNPANGDRIIYKHHTRPEFDLWGLRIRFEIKSRDWQLRVMARMRFLRRLFKNWHARERKFRDWYERLVDKCIHEFPADARDYQRWLAILSSPADVTGYRQVRYPKMDAARRRGEQLLATDPQDFEPAVAADQPAAAQVSLPVLTPTES